MTPSKRLKKSTSKMANINSSLKSEWIKNLFEEYFDQHELSDTNKLLKKVITITLDSCNERFIFFSIPDLKVIYINPSMMECLGLKTKNQLGVNLNKYLRSKSKTSFANSLELLISNEKPLPFEMDILKNNGSIEEAIFYFYKIEVGEKTIGIAMASDKEQYEARIKNLEQSSNQYRSLVENIYGVFFSVDAFGIIKYTSPSVEKLTGFKPREMLGNSFQKYIFPDDLPGLMDNFKITLNGQLGTYDYRIVNKKGKPIWVRSYSFVIGKSDHPEGLNGILIDITENKKYEDELQESRRDLLTLFNTIKDLVFVLDVKGKILKVNNTVLEQLGYSETEIIGKNVVELHPSNKQREAVLLIKEIIEEKRNTCPLPLVKKNGDYLPVETVATRGKWAGKDVLFGVSRDITDRLETQEALHQKTEELDHFFSNALDLLCIADTDGYFRRLNTEWESTLGWPIIELEGRRFLDFVHPEDVEATIKALEQLSKQKEVINFVNRYRCKNNSYKWIEWRSYPAGQKIYAAARDITEKKSFLIALEESEKKYRTLIENSLSGIYIIQDNEFKYCNQCLADIFGYETNELIGNKIEKVIDREFRPIVKKMLNKRLSGEVKSAHYSFKGVRKDNTKIDVEVFGGRIIYEGRPAVQGMLIDITERKHWEDSLFSQLKRIQSQQSSIVELATNPSVVSGDIDTALRKATEITSKALNIERASIWLFNEDETEISCLDLFEKSKRKHTSGISLIVKDHPKYFSALKTGRGLDVVDAWKNPYTLSFAKDYLIPNNIVSLIDSPIRREGKVIGIVCCEHIGSKREWFTDEIIFAGETADQILQIFQNSERRRTIEALNESEEQFSTFMNHVPAMVFVKDTDGKLTYINKAFKEYFGEDWQNKTVFEKLPRDIAGVMEADDKRTLKKGMNESIETLNTLKGRGRIFQKIKFSIPRSSKEPLIGGFALDITERVKAEEALKLNTDRIQSLLKINQMAEAPVSETTAFALDEAVRLTKSKYGFLAFLNETETDIETFYWSKAAHKDCKLPSGSLVVAVSNSGLLSQVIKDRNPVIVNDYSASIPWKKGYPKGHVNLERIIAVPVFSGSRIKVIAAIANKENEYKDDDATQLTLLMEGMWNLIERKSHQEIIQQREATLNSIFRAAPIGIGMVINREFVEINDTVCTMTGYSREELLGKNARILYPSEEEYDRVGFELYHRTSEEGINVVETQWVRKDGLTINIMLRSAFIDDASLNKKVTFTALDITEQKQIEQMLQYERAQLLSIFNSFDEIVYITDPHTYEILYVNKKLRDSIKKDPIGGICYREFQGFEAPCDFCTNEIILKQNPNPYRWEHYNDLIGRHYSIVDRIIKWPDGRDVRFELAIDITDQKKAEIALKESQSFLESIYNGAELPMLVCDISGAGEYTVAGFNPAYERLGNLSFQDFIGKKLETLLRQFSPSEKDFKKVLNNYDLCINKGETIQTEESAHLNSQQTWWLTRLTPLRNAEDKIYRIVTTTMNITDRKKAEEALRISENRLRQIIDLVPHFIFAKDNDGKFIIVNKAVAEAYGTTVEALTGKMDVDFSKNEQETEHFRKDDMEVINEGIPKIIPEELITDSTGKKRLLHTTKIPFIISDSISPGVLGVSVDITENKRIEKERENLIKELETKNSELESFTYTVSHDLKSPLITIKGFIGMLETDIQSNDKERVDLDLRRIKDAANKMAELLDDLLELSRIGRVSRQPIKIPVQTLVNEALSFIRWRLEKKNLQVIVQPDMPVAYGDGSRLVEVFQNLIENAIKFMGKQMNPRVEIGSKIEGGEQVIYVKDNGIGIDPKYHETIFGLFNKLDAKSEGTGIGLALVKRIIEVHGGRVWVESQGKNLGTTFLFTLPLRER